MMKNQTTKRIYYVRLPQLCKDKLLFVFSFIGGNSSSFSKNGCIDKLASLFEEC